MVWARRFQTSSRPQYQRRGAKQNGHGCNQSAAAGIKSTTSLPHTLEGGADDAASRLAREARAKEVEAAAKAAEVAAAAAFTFAHLGERYVREYAERNTKASSAAETVRLLGRVAPHFGNRPLKEIKKAHILELLSQYKPKRAGFTGLIEANGFVNVTKRVFRWALEQDLVEVDPSVGVKRPLKNLPTRDRFLDDEEIVSLWGACEALGWPWGRAVQLMLLTAQRGRKEIAGMRWQEIDQENVWHIPAERTKNGKAHDVALSDLALKIIDAVPKVEAPVNRDFLFSVQANVRITSFDYAKLKLDERMTIKAPWRLHDLRRTATTGMANLKIPPHVAEFILNHQSREISGVAGVYNRFKYIDERRDALQAWGEYVAKLVGANVVQLRA